MRVILDMDYSRASLASFQVWLVFIDYFREAQFHDLQLMKIRGEVDQGLRTDFTIRGDETFMIGIRHFVPTMDELKREILDVAYSFVYARRIGSIKMYHTLREFYSWVGMKRDIADYVVRFLVCQ